MRIRLLFVLSTTLFLVATGASAGPKEDVAAATIKWGETLGQNDPDKVLALYAPDAVLWGTLSPTVRADRAALRDYFVTAFKVLPNLICKRRRTQNTSGALQLHAREGWGELDDCGPSLVGNATSPSVEEAVLSANSIASARRQTNRSDCNISPPWVLTA